MVELNLNYQQLVVVFCFIKAEKEKKERPKCEEPVKIWINRSEEHLHGSSIFRTT
jgi:hypothetical protein